MKTLAIEIGKPVARCWGSLAGAVRQGILLHYDASASDKGAVAWLEDDARVDVSYHYLVLDDGRVIQVAPPHTRAWHAGVCKPSRSEFTYRDGNGAFYGVAIAAKDGETATLAQLESVVALCHYLYWLEQWPTKDSWRVTGHNDECWPRTRKIDPVGSNPQNPVLSVQLVRDRFAATTWRGIP